MCTWSCYNIWFKLGPFIIVCSVIFLLEYIQVLCRNFLMMFFTWKRTFFLANLSCLCFSKPCSWFCETGYVFLMAFYTVTINFCCLFEYYFSEYFNSMLFFTEGTLFVSYSFIWGRAKIVSYVVIIIHGKLVMFKKS